MNLNFPCIYDVVITMRRVWFQCQTKGGPSQDKALAAKVYETPQKHRDTRIRVLAGFASAGVIRIKKTRLSLGPTLA